MKKIILLLIIMFSFILGQTCPDGAGFDDDDFCVPGKLTSDELEVLGGTPGVGKILTDDGTGAGIAIWSVSAGTDDQTIDVFSISGDNVQLSLEDDGEATKTVDISTTTAVTANSAKNTNVPTELSVGTVGVNTVAITSDGGADDVTIPAALVGSAGLLTTAKWAEIETNNSKNTNVSTALTLDTPTSTTVPINSDGSSPDITLIEATTSTAGLLGAAKWNEIVANTFKNTMAYPSAGIALSTGSAWSASIANNSGNWNTAYTDRLKWDGGSTDLVPGTGRTSLGGTTIGQNIFTSTNPSNVRFGRANADNTFDWLSDANFRTAINVDVAGTDNSTTDLSEGTSTETTVDVNSSDGNNATLVSASTSRAGLLTKAKWDEIEANTTKITTQWTTTGSDIYYNTGNVGIGFDTPSSKLSIHGGLHVGGASDAGDNNLLVDGTVIIGTDNRHPILGDTNPGVSRTIYLTLQPGATPNTNINITDNSLSVGLGWNYPSITSATNLAKSGTSGSFSLNVDGRYITLDLTETVISSRSTVSSGVIKLNSASTTVYTLQSTVSGGNLSINCSNLGGGVVDWTSILDAGDRVDIQITFITST